MISECYNLYSCEFVIVFICLFIFFRRVEIENRQNNFDLNEHRKKSSDLRRRLKAVSDVDEGTLGGRLLHTREAATGNARSPLVVWRIGGKKQVKTDKIMIWTKK